MPARDCANSCLLGLNLDKQRIRTNIPFVVVPTYLLLRQKASWAYRLRFMSSAFGTDLILAIPGDTWTNPAK